MHKKLKISARDKAAGTGFTLVEVLVAILILAITSIGVLGMFQFSAKVITESKARIGAITIANEVSETIHNLPYDKVGTVGGLVPGSISQSDSTTLNNINYNIAVSVDYVDDPFDGTVEAGTDELGNDYKKVRIAVSWLGHFGTKEVVSVTTIAPKGIEANQGAGVLWINTIDANGQPVSQASIHIINNQTNPIINDSSHQTNSLGYYYSSVPQANSSYHIIVTKDGYSTDSTCSIDPDGTSCSDSAGNPNPIKPDATVIEGSLTRISFAIDKIATLDIHTLSQTIPSEWTVNTDVGTADQFFPAIALGADQNYYFAWQDFRNYNSRIYTQKYTAQTKQWSNDLAMTSSDNQGGADLAIDKNNNIYITWHDDKNNNQDIYFNKYDTAGNGLFSQPIKVNTDSTSADQIYPKIALNASSTAEYIAFKDERAGNGKSDIYLQKFDVNGQMIWASELKVNANSSSMYKATDSFNWDFNNLADYQCDGGNCDGTTNVKIVTGVAQLVPIKICNGTASDCATFSSATSCTNQSTCNWDAEGPCSGDTCGCSTITDQNQCISAPSCSWQAGAQSCSGNCSCGSIGSKNTCKATSGCSWFFWFCYDNPGCNCNQISSQSTCQAASCSWGSQQGTCSGTCLCQNQTTGPICTQTSCNWDIQGPCSGTTISCSNFLTQLSCQNQTGCQWTESGAGYPANGPSVLPLSSLTVSNLVSWDSFTETATKNGGEIYYQLSDDGVTWKYWNGTNWAQAGGPNYNTASVINDHIKTFSTTRGKIIFKAFLLSNGSQQINLDQIDIGYSHTTSGGGYSQSVNLAIDQDENIYVVWEDYQIDNYDIFIQKIDPNGNIVWPNDIRINTNAGGNQNNPVVKIDNENNIYIFWEDDRNGDNDIYGQKYDSAGNVLWPNGDQAISSHSGSVQENPRAALDSSGNIFVVWQDIRNGDTDIYTQKINSAGTTQWPNDIRINANTTGDQKNPGIIINQAGNLVVTWQDNRSGNYDIIAAEYAADPNAYTNTANVPLVITGAKKVGTNPDIFKYSQNLSTNASGQLLLNNLEWDTYSISLQAGSRYTIISTEPPLPVSLNPGDNITINLNLE
ncbi:MAG: prepilin-type N-terminal cleavage/methylation domain-containing protein [Patescibacteria group bacterium]